MSNEKQFIDDFSCGIITVVAIIVLVLFGFFIGDFNKVTIETYDNEHYTFYNDSVYILKPLKSLKELP